MGLALPSSFEWQPQHHSLFVGLLADLVRVALGLLGDPVAGVSDGVHFENVGGCRYAARLGCMWVVFVREWISWSMLVLVDCG